MTVTTNGNHLFSLLLPHLSCHRDSSGHSIQTTNPSMHQMILPSSVPSYAFFLPPYFFPILHGQASGESWLMWFPVRATREALVFFSCFSPLTLHLKLVTETELFSFSSYIYLPLFIFIFPEMFTSIFAYLRHTSPNSPFLPEHTHTRPLGSNDYFF